jgi:SAM-dependent methyltransferase
VTEDIRYTHTGEIHNLRSPSVIVPDIIRLLRPSSVVDIGCGVGTFLSVFKSHGVNELLGIDGGWVLKEQLYVDEGYFVEADLEKPVELAQRFDLAICVEVAEHLTAKSADTIVDTLCSASDFIVFSAAIPGQGGQNHVNEQPFGYWQEKFAARNYRYFDIFRQLYWNDERVDWWYKQNMFLVANKAKPLSDEIERTKIEGTVLTAVHPELYAVALTELERLRSLVNELNSPSGILKLAGRKIQRTVTGTHRPK